MGRSEKTPYDMGCAEKRRTKWVALKSAAPNWSHRKSIIWGAGEGGHCIYEASQGSAWSIDIVEARQQERNLIFVVK